MPDSVVVEIGGAVTVLNAIATGIGAAIGINTFSKVTIEPSEQDIFEINPPMSDGRLIEACLHEFKSQYGVELGGLKITTTSPFPPSRGLKTSSAISTALVKGLATYFQMDLSISQIIELAANASINAMVSITGAYDDAYACYFGGVVYTDNKKKEVLGMFNAPTGFDVLLLVPKDDLPKTRVNVDNIDRSLLAEARNAFEERKLFEAIYYNTMAYAPLLHPNFAHIEKIEELGAEIVGLNGAGPSLFAVCKPSRTKQIRKSLEVVTHYEIIETKFRKLTQEGLEVFYNVDD